MSAMPRTRTPDPTHTTHWIKVGCLDDIPVRGARRIRARGVTIALFRTADDRVYALEDRCPHLNGPLSQGIVHDECVTCPLHNLVISLASGDVVGPDSGQVRTFAVRLDGDAIKVALISAEPDSAESP